MTRSRRGRCTICAGPPRPGWPTSALQPRIIEAVLNHVSGHKGGVAGIYNRSSYEREVRAALALWADHVRALIEGGERKVVPLRA